MNLGWKHTRVLSGDEHAKCCVMSEPVAFIALTKNPYSWLLSLHKRPHSYDARIKSLEWEGSEVDKLFVVPVVIESIGRKEIYPDDFQQPIRVKS